MIFQRMLFYKVLEMAINSFFNSLSKNFRTLDLNGGTRISVKELKVGDKFSKVMYVDGDGVLTWEYYDVTISEIESEDRVWFDSLYRVVKFHRLYGGTIWYEGTLSKDVSATYSTDVDKDNIEDDSEDYSWDDCEYCISPRLFNRVFNDIKPFMEYDTHVMTSECYLIGWK